MLRNETKAAIKEAGKNFMHDFMEFLIRTFTVSSKVNDFLKDTVVTVGLSMLTGALIVLCVFAEQIVPSLVK